MNIIEEREGICGGEPCVGGTRIPMGHLQALVEKLGWSWERIAVEYPHVPRGVLFNALAVWFNATSWRDAVARKEDS